MTSPPVRRFSDVPPTLYYGLAIAAIFVPMLILLLALPSETDRLAVAGIGCALIIGVAAIGFAFGRLKETDPPRHASRP